MGLATVQLAIVSWFGPAFSAALAALSPTITGVTVLYPGDKRSSLSSTYWARFQLQSISSRIVGLGEVNTLEDYRQVTVEVFEKDGQGFAVLDKVADATRRLFTTAAATPSLVGGAQFCPTGLLPPRIVGPSPDAEVGTHRKVVVIAPFRFEHTA